LPVNTSGTTRCFSSSEPKFSTGGKPITIPARRPCGIQWRLIVSKMHVDLPSP
jgi:hypothetical protein